jgi:hypothetical protein
MRRVLTVSLAQPIAAKLDRSQSDSAGEKQSRPGDSFKRANSTGNVDKARKSKDSSTSKVDKASNEESIDGVRTDKLQASGDSVKRSVNLQFMYAQLSQY